MAKHGYSLEGVDITLHNTTPATSNFRGGQQKLAGINFMYIVEFKYCGVFGVEMLKRKAVPISSTSNVSSVGKKWNMSIGKFFVP